MYQKCPVCDGIGVIYLPVSCNTSEKCPTCKGHRIISEITGLPPVNNTPTTRNSGDFRDNAEQFYNK